MKRLLDYATEFIKQSDWRDLAILKVCLFTIGLLFGMAINEKARKPVAAVSATIFATTYSVLIAKLLKVIGILPFKKHALLQRNIDDEHI